MKHCKLFMHISDLSDHLRLFSFAKCNLSGFGLGLTTG